MKGNHKRAITQNKSQKPTALFYLSLTFLISWLVFLLIELFKDQLYVVFPADTYLSLHIIAELFSIIVSISIFGFGWFTYKQSKNNYTLFLAIAFLGIGLLDLVHTMSFPGMPTLITPSSTDKGIQFWLAARLFTAFAFLLSAFMIPDSKKVSLPKKTLLIATLTIVVADFVWVHFFPQTLLVFFEPGIGLTPVKIFLEYTVIIITAIALLLYYYRYNESNRQIYVWFMCALILSMFSEVAFTLYISAYDTYNLIGHIFKVAAFILIYRGVFIVSTMESYDRVEESEEKFSRAFLNSPNLMSITVPETGKIIEINDSFCHFFGYTRAELVGKSTKGLMLWADFRQREGIIHRLNNGESVHNAEIVLRTRSGQTRYAIASMDYINLADKRYLLSVATDITDRKKAENALLENEQRIKELSELRAKFIQIIAHQLRTPLSSIRWNLESLLDSSLGKLTSAQRQFINLTHDANTMVIDRINDLLTTMDIEENRITYEKTAISLDSLLKSVITELEQKWKEKELRCTFSFPAKSLPPVEADQQKIRLVFRKLIENAITYTPKKGKITGTLKRTGSSIRFEITDSGIGIPEAEQSHTFDSFFRASNAFTAEPDASGVGLSIAKHFIEDQGGGVGFTSKEGKGSTFWFELPLKVNIHE